MAGENFEPLYLGCYKLQGFHRRSFGDCFGIFLHVLFVSLEKKMRTGNSPAVKVITVTRAARSFTRLVDQVERDGEEIVLVRKGRWIARLVPEPPAQTAFEALGDLYRILDERAAQGLSSAISRSREGKGRSLLSLRRPRV